MHVPTIALRAALVAALSTTVPGAFAQAPKDGAARQAEQLRRMQQQQQQLQQELSRLSAENSNLAAQKSSLEGDLAAARAARDRTGAALRQGDTRIAAVRRDLEAADARATSLAAELEQARRDLKAATERVAATDRALGAAREDGALAKAVLAARDDALRRSVVLERTRGTELEQCREHNGALALLSSELLAAIDRGGLGTALVGTEPFNGFKRVRIESLMQDYRDRVADNRLAEPKR
ncbi:MAG: hypothetical protein ACK54X_10990 [Burkholderiales bacterium]